MSNWSELEARCNPAFTRVFGEAATYTPATGSAYQITVCFGRPDNIEGIDPAFRHAWVPLADFAADPAAGDALTVGEVEYTVFSVHREGEGVWLSLNAS